MVTTNTKTTPAQPGNKPLNVYAKLLKAREMFLAADVKKSGKNIKLEFNYFELRDIVPIATGIGNKVGLLFLTTFEVDYAIMTIINTDNPEEQIIIKSPMKEIPPIISKTTGGAVNNPIQDLGAVETYQRRYLYMAALDIVENDTFDMEAGDPDKMVKKQSAKPKAPVTTEQREAIKKEIVGSTGQAEPLQIEALKKVMTQLLDLDSEQESMVQEIVLQTDNLTNITKEACEELITELRGLVESYTSNEKAESK